ncbi:MAG: 23S rRNA (guanosine(2251)-2'-O)-methyltransferase RlmB [Ruminococcaceae bacterium]|nr:23S rRNA (guanosine(2251)-2'-O)-methyltransferase RlmB [Oscillospiraceae bacterium]
MSNYNNNTDNTEILYGRNPVIEALKSGVSVNKLLIAQGDNSGSMKVILSLARERQLVYQSVDKKKLDDICGHKNHQGVVMYISAGEYADVSDILDRAREKNEPPFILILDEIQDPHNLGAMIRTAEACGVHGIIIPKRRSVQLTGAVAKASAGALAHMLIARVPNLPNVIDELKKDGVWIAGTDASGDTEFFKADFKGPIGIVIGSEGYGIGELVRKKCDYIITIPMVGKVSSLNASVAAGLVMYEIFKERYSK